MLAKHKLERLRAAQRRMSDLIREWFASIRLDPSKFGTHTLGRTKAMLIYRLTGNLRAAQLLLGHSKIESTVCYPGIAIDEVIEIAEKIEGRPPVPITSPRFPPRTKRGERVLQLPQHDVK